MKISGNSLLWIFALSVFAAAAPGDEPAPRPSSFYGTITAAGQPVSDGTLISAAIEGVVFAQTETFQADGTSVFRLDVPADNLSTAAREGGQEGQLVELLVNGSAVPQTGLWQSSLYRRIDLTATLGTDLSIVKDDGRDVANPGDTLIYTLTVANEGPVDATGVVVEDALPEETTFVSAGDGGTETDGVVTWPAFDLPVGSSVVRTLTVEVALSFPAGTTGITNGATVRSDGADGVDPAATNNTAIDVDTLAGGPDLAVAKSADLTAVAPGQDVVYTLTLSNDGFQGALDTALSDTLPPEVTFLTASDDGREVGGVVTWPAFTLDAGASVTRTIRVRLPGDVSSAVTQLTNTASAASSNGPDLDPSDNSAVHVLPLVRETDLAVLSVDRSAAFTDPQTLAISGELAVEVANQGNADALAAFDVLIFEDLDGDGAFDSATDNPLGQTEVASGILVGESAVVGVPVTGTVLFRDNRLYAFADAADVIPELDEANNVEHSARGCQAIPTPEDFDPVVELSWPLPGTDVRFSADSLSTPIVVQLTDDNGDGRLDERDVPLNPQPRLRAISGEDGRRIFDAFPPISGFFQIFALTGMAAADIDLDGRSEIVVSTFDYRGPTGRPNRLAAYEHNGALKWVSATYNTHPDGDSLTNRDNPSIADLDGDGVPEIVVGANVFNANGSLRWAGTGGQGYQSARNANGFDSGAVSIVADLDLEGEPEVVTGNTAYRADGSTWWQIPFDDGYPAVADFDADDFPEIVVVSRGNVRLHEHDGTLIWSAELPGAGAEAGGAPTVANFDADPEPEIGVAGSTQYAVFESDGTVKWQTATQDGSSNMTGSTVFDLDGNGRFEVIYRDETALRIYRGEDGVALYELPLSSITLNEQPVVADVDLDGNAEIVVTSDVANGVSVPARTRGLWVIGDDNWVAARTVWNQHAYHISNVGDDGVVPAREEPSWLTHNTYRANVAPATGAFQAPDLSASRLTVDLLGFPTVQVTARIGNGGTGPVSAGVPVAFYDGDPALGSGLVATASLSRRLAPGEFEDVTVTFTAAGLGVAEVFASADDDGTPQGRRSECDETNNVHGVAYDTDVLGLVLAMDDGTEAVRPGETVTYTLSVANAAQVTRTGVTLTDTLPPHTVVVSASDGGVEAGGVVSWPAFDLAPGATASRSLTLSVDVAIPVSVSTLTNTAEVSDDGSQGGDPTPQNNTATDTNAVLTVLASAGGPYSGDEGDEIVFDASASSDRDGEIVAYAWDLDGDGDFDDATGPLASRVFDDDGVFTVAVEVEDSSGEVDTASATVTVANRPPSFELGADLALVEGTSAVFDAVAFSDPGTGDTHSATIDWGDGTTEPVALFEADGSGTLDAVHTYLDDGVFPVELCLADDDGASLCDQVTVTVANSPPDVLGDNVAVVEIDEGSEADVGLPFKDLGPEDEHTAVVDWDDGTIEPGVVTLDDGAGVILFEDAFDEENGGRGKLNFSALTRWTVSEGTVDLIGSGLFDFLPGNGLYLDLDGSTGNAGKITSVPIAFTPGRYQLRFELAGSRRGGTDTVIVRVGDLVEEEITLSSSEPFTPFALPFTVAGPLALEVSFEHLGGDNVGLLLDDVLVADECLLTELDDGGFLGGGAGTGSGAPAASTCGFAGGVHLYGDDGEFAVEICVADDDGGEDCGLVPVVVRNVLPQVEAGDDRVAFVGDQVELAATFVDPGLVDPHTATVDWGDGTVETAAITPDASGGTVNGFTVSGVHQYAAEGDYTVRLCVTDDDGEGCDSFVVFWREPELDVAVAIAADVPVVRPGDVVEYTIRVVNEGSLAPSDVAVANVLPPHLDFVAAGSGGTLSGDTVTWLLPTLAFGETVVLTVTVQAPDTIPFGIEAVSTVSASDGSGAVDVDPADNTASVSVDLWNDETPHVDPIGPDDGGEPLSGVEGATVSLAAAFSSGPEQVLVDDDFNGENGGRGTLNYFGWANWSVTNGSVDLIGNGFFDFLRGNGLYVDLDGSTGNAGRFATRTVFELEPGVYTLEFDLAGSRRGDTNTVILSLGSAFEESITLVSSEPFLRFVRTIRVDETTVADLAFDHQGGNNLGLLLDDVLFVRTCNHTATIDWGDGSVETVDVGTGCGTGSIESGHVYLEDGVYPVEVCVTDEQGDTHCETTEAVIANAPPVVTAEGLTVAAREPFSLDTGSFTDLGVLDLHTATMDWGDGTLTAAEVNEVPGSGTVTASHTYLLPDVYAAELCVTDDDGGVGCTTFTVTATGSAGAPDLVATKVDELGADLDEDGVPSPGDFLRYNVTVRNAGALPATQVVLRDVIPANTTILPGGIVPGSGMVVSEDPLEVALGEIAPGAEELVHFYVEIATAVPAGVEAVSNQGVVLSAELPAVLTDDPDVGGVNDPTVTMLSARPRLAVEKTDVLALDANGDGAAAPGDVIEYVLTLRSLGNAPVTGVELIDPVPEHTVVVPGSLEVDAPASATAVVISEDPPQVSIDSLDQGTEAIVTFQVQVASTLPSGVGQIVNQGVAAADGLPDVLTDDPDVGGDTDPTLTEVRAEPVIAVEKTDVLFADTGADGFASPGDEVLYQVRITNSGMGSATAVTLTDVIPRHTALVAATVQTSQGVVVGEDPVQAAFGELTPGATVTVSFRVRIDNPFPPAELSISNQATVASAELGDVVSDDPGAGGEADATVTEVFITPDVAVDDVTVTEGTDSEAVFIVALSVPSNRPVMVSYETSDREALAGLDYESSSGSVTLAAGTVSSPVRVPVLDDPTDEPDETFVVTLSAPQGRVLADAEGLGTIVDDDDPPRIFIDDVTVAEGDMGTVPGVLTLALERESGFEVTIDYLTADATAFAGSDYVTGSGQASIPAGALTATVTVEVLGDLVDELDETFDVVLSNPQRVLIGDGVGEVTIDDDDEALISIDDVTVDEGDSGTVDAVFTVSLSTLADREIRVSWATAPETATAPADYLTASGLVVFPAGSTAQTLVVEVVGDLILEELEETFRVELSDPVETTIADDAGIGTILDDEECPGPNLLVNPGAETRGANRTATPGWTLAAGDWQRNLGLPEPVEGRATFAAGQADLSELYQDVDVTAFAARIDAGIQPFEFEGFVRTFEETPPDVVRIVVEYRDATNSVVLEAFDSGEITSPLDWQRVSDVALAPAGTRFVRVRLLGSRFTGTSSINTVIDGFVDALVARPRRAPTLVIDDVTVYEQAGPAVFTVSLACAWEHEVTVSYATADDTALDVEDYLAVTGTLTFPVGTTSLTVSVPIVEGDVDEPTETFFALLSNVISTGAPVLLDPTGVGTILDDDFCQRSHGFWKTHPEEWPVDYLVMGGVEYEMDELEAFLSARGGDQTLHLALQLVATKLNLARGSDPYILGVVESADAFLEVWPPGSDPRGEPRREAEALKDQLDAYNNACSE